MPIQQFTKEQLNAFFKLSQEETAGTETVYLPLNRFPGQAPEVTLVFQGREDEDGTPYLVCGMAVCSAEDQFSRLEGRGRAFRRLKRRALEPTEDLCLEDVIYSRLQEIEDRHPTTLSPHTLTEIGEAIAVAERGIYGPSAAEA